MSVLDIRDQDYVRGDPQNILQGFMTSRYPKRLDAAQPQPGQ
jgi:hypothetical protein